MIDTDSMHFSPMHSHFFMGDKKVEYVCPLATFTSTVVKGQLVDHYHINAGDLSGEYTGNIKNGKKHGEGSIVYDAPPRKGNVYEGGWDQDQRHGRGIYKWTNGCIYDGDWCHDKIEGSGMFIWPESGVYVGEFADNVRSGWGKYVCVGGQCYEGEWAHDVRQGFGRMTYADGSMYEGHWVGDLRQGRGRVILPTGEARSGFWIADVRGPENVKEGVDAA